ncbi:Flagellar FliJ protein [Pseudidiomarina piscicola]|uniref:Flagellar FliJ protein n=1 Tax=Pseudidiomarina piscicola TaxID=2614830 RepID=A0A6S6WNI6_9GAMM|nr:flagellar export protein FliJ [Pseudidiomarina piscicola]CAB0151050.1 Flagellar FliJ protein [Pseudidiomarina piscicola]VZT40561.1 Flagellar FliJ protein [Pseudomonas aeruginosa]
MNNGTLAHLTEQAEQARTQAAKVLADDRNNTQKIEQQLKVLKDYRNEYAQQLQLQLMAGMKPSMLSTYRSFLVSLDNAILQAQQTLAQHQQKVSSSQQTWRDKQQRWQSFDLLQTRQQQQIRQRAERREQNLTDELSMASYLRQQKKA